MSAEKYAEYVGKVEKAASDYVRGEILLQASRDYDLTTAEFMRLDNWARRWMNDRKGRK